VGREQIRVRHAGIWIKYREAIPSGIAGPRRDPADARGGFSRMRDL
jgi:hypothetical protein